MLYKNLTAKELYASIPTNVIEPFFHKGLEMDNDRLAVSAMEELIRRGDTDMVFQGLRQAFERGDVKVKTTTATMIARSLSESCRGIDPFLHQFGKFLFRAEGPDPFREFIESEEGRLTLLKSIKAGNVALHDFCISDIPEATMHRFGKYLNIDAQKG